MPRKEENIYERKDGRFEARYLTGRDENGRAKYSSVYGKSRAEVREKLAETKRELYGDPSPHEGRTFREVAEEWLEKNRDNIASTTHDRYKDALERDIYPEYGDTIISDVTYGELNRFLLVVADRAEKKGRKLNKSGTLIIKTVMSNVLQYASMEEPMEKADITREPVSYEELSSAELERICLRAKYNHCQECLCALLTIYCGMRIGELCGLACDDVDMDKMEVYVHSTVHRIRNRDANNDKKTAIVVEEIPRKTQIRTVPIPAILKDYVKGFAKTGTMLIRPKNDEMGVMDPRTLENRLTRVMDAFNIGNITFERLRKTYINGKADEEILNNTFLGIHPDRPYSGSVDKEWLTKEMQIDLQSLRLLLGFSHEEMAGIIGVSESGYRAYENGNKTLSWNQYMSLLFLFRYNMRTKAVSDALGLLPQSLQQMIKIGG